MSMLEDLKSAFTNTNEMVLITDGHVNPSNINILFANKAVSVFTGYAKEELTTLNTVQSPDIDPQTLHLYKEARRRREAFNGFMLGEKKTGEYFWVDISFTPIHDNQKDKWYFLHKPRVAEEYELIKDRAKMLEWCDLTSDMAKIGLWEWYPKTDQAFFSESMYSILGLDSDKILPSFDLYKNCIVDQDREVVENKMNRLANEGGEDVQLHRIKHNKTGEIRYLEGYGKRFESNSEVVKLYGIIQDVTEFQEQLEHARLFQQAVESTNSGIVITDYAEDDNPIIYCNEHFLSMTDYQEAEVLGNNCRFLQDNDRDQEERFELRKAIDNGQSLQTTLRNYTKKGNLFWNQLNIAPIKNTQGEITNFVGVQNDISKEVSLRNQLKESEKKWEKLVQLNPDLIAIHKFTEIEYINQSGVDMLGYEDASEMKKQEIFSLFHKDEHDRLNKRIQRLSDKNPTEFATFKINTKQGAIRYIRLRSVPIKLEKENFILTVGQDITEQYNYRLELEKLNEQKNILIKEIHHRVKNNMAIISGLLELQKDRMSDDSAIEALNNSQLRLQTMANVHEQLYQEHDFSHVNSKKYFKNLISTIKDTYQKTNISVRADLDEISLNVNQAIPIGLLINELIINSFKHAFDSDVEGRITVDLSSNNELVKVTVSDDGRGLPSDFNTQNPDTLGYTIIQTLVKQLDAQIDIKSNEGTSVHIQFKKEQMKGSASNIQKMNG